MSDSKKVQEKIREFETKKSVHIHLTQSTKAALRISLFSKGLCMQEALEECATRIVEEDNYMLEMLDTLVERKRIKSLSKVSESDVESVFNVIEQVNPFGDPKK